MIHAICHLLCDGYKIHHFFVKLVGMDTSSASFDALRPICLVLAFFDNEHNNDPYVVKLRSKTKSPVKGMFGPHFVKVCSVTKSSNKGHMFGPHLVEVRSETKSSDKGAHFGPHLVKVHCMTKTSNKGHNLDHIWSKFAA